MFSEGARKNNTRHYTNPSSLKQDILDFLKGTKRVHNYLAGTGKIITNFKVSPHENGSFYLIFSLGEDDTSNFLVPTIHDLHTEVISSGKRLGPKKLIIYYDNKIIVISPDPYQPRKEEFDRNLLLQEISTLRYLYDRGLSYTQGQEFTNALDRVHKILITMKVENDKKMGVSTMRLLEVLEECNASDISKSMQFSGLISTINNQIMNTKGRNNSAMNNRLVESFMTKDQKAYAYKYLETLKALIIKYRTVLSILFPEYPNERVKPTDTIQNRIIFIYQIISYLYTKDVENSKSTDIHLIEIKTKTQLPTIFHQIIMDTNLLNILKIIANQENFDMSNVGSLAYPYSKSALDNYIQDLYHKLMGTRTNRS